MAKEFTDASFKEEVLGGNTVALIDLWAEWCGPCRMMSPIVEQLADEYADKAIIGKLNVDDNPNTPTAYGVRGIPTFLVIKNGQLFDKVVGAVSKQVLAAKLEEALK